MTKSKMNPSLKFLLTLIISLELSFKVSLFSNVIAILLPVLAIIIFIWHKKRKKKKAKADKEKGQE